MGRTDKEIYRVIDNVNSYYRINSESKKELLLNKYPNAAAAYSLRLLDGYYRGPLVRVRRDDGVEVDVYPDYNNQLSLDSLVTNVPVHTTNDGIPDADYTFQLSLSSLGEFVGATGYSSTISATDATVCVWYDQSGNENNAKQTAASNQPKIYDSVAGDLVRENGKPSVQFDGAAQYFDAPSVDSANLHSFVAYASDSNSTEQSVYNFRGTNNNCLGLNFGAAGRIGTNDDNIGKIITVDGQHLVSVNHENDTLHFDSVAGTDSVSARSGDGFYIGSRGTIYYLDGSIQELILYTTNQTSNRGGIEQDINSFYQIDGYTPPQPLLDEFGGAAAAYSLRLLSSTYNGPLVRIRRTIDNTEVDVYPDSDGEFSIYSTIQDGGTELTTGVTGGSTDKTTLHEFLYGQDTDCTVVRWYDQASGNHATQDVATSQPKIYDSSTGVVTENGKPAVLFDGVDDGYLTPLASSDPSTYFITCDNNGNSGTPASPTQTNSFFIDQLTYLRVRIGIEFSTATQASAEFQLQYILHDTTSSEAAVNGATATSGTVNAANGSVVSIGQAPLGAKWSGHIYELIIYQSDQSTNRTGIESNINQHYNIY